MRNKYLRQWNTRLIKAHLFVSSEYSAANTFIEVRYTT